MTQYRRYSRQDYNYLRVGMNCSVLSSENILAMLLPPGVVRTRLQARVRRKYFTMPQAGTLTVREQWREQWPGRHQGTLLQEVVEHRH